MEMTHTNFMDSRFWAWYKTHSIPPDEQTRLNEEALKEIVASVNSGDVVILDGVDSPLSTKIKTHHCFNDFEMNSNWVLTSQEWTCPCCARSKFDIARPGNKGQILAKLVVHHDHMGDAMEEAFYTALREDGAHVEQTAGARLVQRIGSAFAAHEEVLICEDCNNADAEAARFIGSPKHFTFSPNQISGFIQAQPHKSHKVDRTAIVKVWAAAKQAYELRMRLISDIAHAAATDSGWFESVANGLCAIPLFKNRANYFDDCIGTWVSSGALVNALGPKKNISRPDLTRWRKPKKQNASEPLPQNYEAILLTLKGCATAWRSLSTDWICPTCGRSKFETIHWGKKGELCFTKKETGANGGWQRRTICHHCAASLMSLKWEVGSRIENAPNDSYVYVTPDELTSILIPSPHCAHRIDGEKAESLVEKVIERLRET